MTLWRLISIGLWYFCSSLRPFLYFWRQHIWSRRMMISYQCQRCQLFHQTCEYMVMQESLLFATYFLNPELDHKAFYALSSDNLTPSGDSATRHLNRRHLIPGQFTLRYSASPPVQVIRKSFCTSLPGLPHVTESLIHNTYVKTTVWVKKDATSMSFIESCLYNIYVTLLNKSHWCCIFLDSDGIPCIDLIVCFSTYRPSFLQEAILISTNI